MNGAIYVVDSENSKISGNSKVDATYVSIQSSCSRSCPFFDAGCYGQLSRVGLVTNRLNNESKNYSPLQVARAEAKAIDNAYNGGDIPSGRNLRLHVAGDSRTITGSRIINNAIGRWIKRGGNKCWSYTHSWKHVPRSEWNHVSMLASVSNVEEANEARSLGYACVIVVAEHKNHKSFSLDGSDTKWIPCPSQVKDVSCMECGLCFDADVLYKRGKGIAFAAHGVKKNEVKRRLPLL